MNTEFLSFVRREARECKRVAGQYYGGSPQMETITMMARYDVESLKSIAKYLFGIEKQLPKYERPTVTPRKMLERFQQMYAAKQ